MATTIVNVKIDPDIKKEAQNVANDLGFTLSALIKGYLRHLIDTREVYFRTPEETKISQIFEIKYKILPVLKKAGVKRASIFGSFAKGTARVDSDVDILVDLPPDTSLLEFVGLRLKLEDMLKRKVDLVEYLTLKEDLKEEALKSQIKIL